MATVTRENIGILNDKLIVTIAKKDYINNIENVLKKQAKTANIPGFRKGMVPAGLVKKMYGQAVMTDEVVRIVEKQLSEYLQTEKLDILAPPHPLEFDTKKIEINNPTDYTFSFELGLKPQIFVDVSKLKVIRYKIEIEEQLVDIEVDRLRTRYGKMTAPETITNDENVLNVLFNEADENGNNIEGGISKANSLLVKYFNEGFRGNLFAKKIDDVVSFQLNNAFDDKELDFIAKDLGVTKEEGDKYFNITITKIGYIEKAELNEEFFAAAFSGKEIKTTEECKKAIKEEIAFSYATQSRNQMHDQIYHQLLDTTNIELPTAFLKRLMQSDTKNTLSEEAIEKEFPAVINSYKWNLLSDKIAGDNNIKVLQDEIKAFAKNQLMGYSGTSMLDTSTLWMDDYVNRMMQDKKFVDDAFYQIQTNKMFIALESQVIILEESISPKAFAEIQHHHHY